jgi:hypothetical protein
MRDTAFDPEAIAADAVALAERLDRRPAGSVPVTHPLVAAVLRARRSVGLPDTTSDGSTDANAKSWTDLPIES